MSELEDRLRRFAYEWHEAMNSPYAVNMMPMLLKAASDVRRLVVPSLEAENAKLRELAKDYEALTATICNERNSCDGCQFDDPERIVCERMRIQTRLSELGVEVD